MTENCRLQMVAIDDAHSTVFDTQTDFLVFVESEQCLRPEFKSALLLALSDSGRLVLAYADETLPHSGQRVRTWKPIWSPERLRGQFYIGFPLIISRELFQLCGGWNERDDRLGIYELALRAGELAEEIIHIPEVLHDTQKPVIDVDSRGSKYLENIQNLVQEHLDRVGISAVARTVHPLVTNQIFSHEKNPRTSIIIPTCGTATRINGKNSVLVEDCVRSVVTKSTYQNYEIVVVYDSDTPVKILENLGTIAHDRLKLVEYQYEFNFSEKINLGAIKSDGDVLLLLNDDTEILSSNWIEEMVALLEQDDVAMVGPMLLLADGRIQSAGHFNYETGAVHVGAGHSADTDTMDRALGVTAERSGLTMACTAVKTKVFNQVGGLCNLFPRAFNDVDFGNKVRLLGYRILWTPKVRISHFESLSRDPKTELFETKLMLQRWGDHCTTVDPYLPCVNFRMVDVHPNCFIETYVDHQLFVD